MFDFAGWKGWAVDRDVDGEAGDGAFGGGIILAERGLGGEELEAVGLGIGELDEERR